jgi:hypothetical protein
VSTLLQHEPQNASALIYNPRGEYLLHLRDNIAGIWEPGSWSLLGGGREPGDASLEDTIRRAAGTAGASINIRTIPGPESPRRAPHRLFPHP